MCRPLKRTPDKADGTRSVPATIMRPVNGCVGRREDARSGARGQRKRDFHVAVDGRRAGIASRARPAGQRRQSVATSPACASQRASLPTAWSIIPHVLLAAWTLEAPASWGNVAGNASPRRSLRQVRRKTSLQTHRRPGNLAFLDAIASVCAAAKRTGRQFAPLESGQGGNLRRSEGRQGVNLRRAEGAIQPLAGEKRGVYCHTRKTGVWTLPVVRKTDALPDRRPGAAEGRGGGEKRRSRDSAGVPVFETGSLKGGADLVSPPGGRPRPGRLEGADSGAHWP